MWVGVIGWVQHPRCCVCGRVGAAPTSTLSPLLAAPPPPFTHTHTHARTSHPPPPCSYSGAIGPLLKYLRDHKSDDAALRSGLHTLSLLVSNSPNRGIIVGFQVGGSE